MTTAFFPTTSSSSGRSTSSSSRRRLAEAALNRAFVEGLWRDWSPDDGRDRSQDVNRVMECLAAPENVSAAIGYYRAMLDPSRLVERYAAEQEATAKVGEKPVLYLHGSDGCLGATSSPRAATSVPSRRPSRRGRAPTWSRARATSSTWTARRTSTASSWTG